jgi:hypothetical protein
MVTRVPGKTLPVLSMTVPVTPPRVCCARAKGARAKSIPNEKAIKKKEFPIFQRMGTDLLGIRVHGLRKYFPEHGSLQFAAHHDSGAASPVKRSETIAPNIGQKCTLLLVGTKERRPMKISLPRINYFYAVHRSDYYEEKRPPKSRGDES